MALKMPKARLMQRSGVITEVDADTYIKDQQPGTLICKDIRCDVELRHVPENKEVGRDIRAYFGRKNVGDHAPNCKYAVVAALRRIAAHSMRYEEINRPLVIGPDNIAILRLNIVLEALSHTGPTAGAAGDDGQGRQGVDTAVGNRVLTPYLRSARAILTLLARLGDASELRDRLRISFNGEAVAWRDFFYGPDDLKRLHRRLQILRDRDRPVHPVAVVLMPLGELTRTESEVLLRCRFASSEASSGGELRVAPKLNCRPPPLTALLPLRTEHIICGLPRASKEALEQRPAKGETKYANIFIDVRSRNQFAIWPH